MKHRKAIRLLASFFAALFLMSGTVFAYEDNYAKNGDLPWRDSETYKNGIYTLNNKMNGTPSTVVIFMAVQNAHYINSMDVVYTFDGKLNYEDKADYLFEFRMGMPANYEELYKKELGGVETTIRQAQFGIYPGFYNFFHYGNNYSNLSGQTPWYAVTLSPNWNLVEKDPMYKNEENPPDDTFVEIMSGDAKRLYVLMGEVDYLNLARDDFEEWAIATEAEYLKMNMQGGITSEIEVEIPEENLQNLLENAKPEVEIEEVKEETTPPPFEMVAPPEEEKPAFSIPIGTIVYAVIGLAVIVALLVFGRKAMNKMKDGRY